MQTYAADLHWAHWTWITCVAAVSIDVEVHLLILILISFCTEWVQSSQIHQGDLTNWAFVPCSLLELTFPLWGRAKPGQLTANCLGGNTERLPNGRRDGAPIYLSERLNKLTGRHSQPINGYLFMIAFSSCRASYHCNTDKGLTRLDKTGKSSVKGVTLNI